MSENITKNPVNFTKYLPLPDSIKRSVNTKINNILNPASTIPLLGSVDYSIKHTKVGDKFVSFFFLESLPSSIYQEFMFNLCNQEGIDLRVVIKDMPALAIQNRAKERLATIEQEQTEVQERGGMRSRMKDQEYEEVDTYAEQLVQGTEKPFMMQFKVTISDTILKELERKTKVFVENVRNFGFEFNLGVYRHHELIKEAIPAGEMSERYAHLLQSSNANYLLPFNFQQIKHKHGVFYGYNYYDLSPVIYNLFSEDSFSMNVIGIMGSGKSATIKNAIWNERFKGFHFVVIDPENEYIELAEGLGTDGDVFKVSRETPINVMGLETYTQDSVKDHVESLKQFFHIFIEDHHFGKGGTLGELLLNYYNQFAFKDKKQVKLINLESFLNYIEAFKTELKFVGLIDNLQVLRKNREYGEYFCGTTNFRVTKPLTVFSLKDVESNPQVFNASMIIISNLFLNVARKKDRRRMLIVDEAWKFFANPISCQMLVGFGGMARKWRLGLTCITQNLTDFNSGNGTIKIISNAQTNIIMKQSKASLEYIDEKDYYELSENEKSILKQKDPGLGIIHRANEHVPIKFTILSTPWLYSQTTHEEDKELKNKGIY
jgi:TraG P-loop domain